MSPIGDIGDDGGMSTMVDKPMSTVVGTYRPLVTFGAWTGCLRPAAAVAVGEKGMLENDRALPAPGPGSDQALICLLSKQIGG